MPQGFHGHPLCSPGLGPWPRTQKQLGRGNSPGALCPVVGTPCRAKASAWSFPPGGGAGEPRGPVLGGPEAKQKRGTGFARGLCGHTQEGNGLPSSARGVTEQDGRCSTSSLAPWARVLPDEHEDPTSEALVGRRWPACQHKAVESPCLHAPSKRLGLRRSQQSWALEGSRDGRLTSQRPIWGPQPPQPALPQC